MPRKTLTGRKPDPPGRLPIDDVLFKLGYPGVPLGECPSDWAFQQLHFIDAQGRACLDEDEWRLLAGSPDFQ